MRTSSTTLSARSELSPAHSQSSIPRRSLRASCRGMSRVGISSCIIHKFKSFHLLSVALYGLEEHLGGTHPESAFPVERAVHDHLLQRLGVLGEPFEAIAVAFKMDNVAKPGMKSLCPSTNKKIMWQSLGWNPLSPRLFLPRLGRFAAPDYPSRRAFRCESRAAGEILIYARTRPLRGSRLRVRSPGLLRQIARICHSGRIRLSPEAARSRSRSPCVRSRRLHPRFSPRYFLAGYRFVV